MTAQAPARDDSRAGASPYLVRRAALVARADLTAAQRRRALSDAADEWLRDLLAAAGSARGVALVAVGGYGRRELLPGSDLDLVVLHNGQHAVDEVAALADAVLYPVWDAGVSVDHSVRTVDEARTVAADDLKAALGLMDARLVAGDAALVQPVRSGVLADWRRAAPQRLPRLADLARDRARRAGDVAYLLEPDLVESRGGLRDTLVLRAVAASWVADPPHTGVREAREWLLTVRDALHRVARRPGERLLLQEQDVVAAALGLADADAVLSRVSAAGRTIAYAADVTWRSAERALRPSRPASRPAGRPARGDVVADGVLALDGEVVLAPTARPEVDPLLPLRAAAAAAQAGLPLEPHSAARLATAPAPPTPWPAAARESLVSLLGAGEAALPVWEALESVGLVERWLHEWGAVRFLPQRNALHVHTVDRHSTQAAVEASRLTRSVPRPDLLLLAALLHDLGKGHPGDHSDVGAALATGIGRRIGLPEPDVERLSTLVRLHLLLPVMATRRDLDDPSTVQTVVDAVGDRDTLDLLAALTEADAIAAGPSTWTPWRAGLVRDLVRRAAARLEGGPPPGPAGLEPWQEDLVLAARPTVVAESGDDGTRVTVVAPDQRGLLATVSAVLLLHRLDVRNVSAQTRDGTAVQVWHVTPRHGDPLDATRLRVDTLQALDGHLDVDAAVARRTASSAPPARPVAAPRVDVLAGATDRATVVEVRAHDAPGLLHRLTHALTGQRASIRTAVVGTLGAEAVDVFYLTDGRGRPLSAERADAVAAALRAAAG